MATETVDHYEIDTDARVQRVAWLLGRAWQGSFLRSRLGRVVDLGGRTYRMAFLGNAVVVTIAKEQGLTRVSTSVQEFRESHVPLPFLDNLLQVDGLCDKVFRESLPSYLREFGHRVEVRVDQVTPPGY